MSTVKYFLKDLTYTLRGVFWGPLKRKRPYMSLVKYYLNKKFNLTPRWEPHVDDVLSAALAVYRVHRVKRPNGKHYFYVMPSANNLRYMLDVMRVFRANGIVLIPHKSKEYGDKWVLVVRDRGQQFMSDVRHTNKETEYFRDTVVPAYTAAHKDKKYLLPQLFGPYSK